MVFEDFLIHYGTPRHSGRYPWGSGENPYQHNANFLAYVSNLRKEGLSDTEIAKGLDMTTSEFRASMSNARAEKRAADAAEALRLKDSGMSNVAIGKQMGINESSVRSLLDPALNERALKNKNTADALAKSVDQNKYIDIGLGAESYLGVSRTRLKNAVEMLKEQGYVTYDVYVDQVGGDSNKKTTIKVLAAPGTTYAEVMKNQADISGVINMRSDDNGKTFSTAANPKSISSDRIMVRYGDEGGADKDGVIELRRGVDDISLGNARYAQVRIAVDDTHYLKGMAVYSDNMPDGVDVIFNTNKKTGTPKMDTMKEMKSDPDNPFGATIKGEESLHMTQRYYTDQNGKKQQSAINIVTEQGDWNTWRKALSSQMLSKQSPTLAKKQLDLDYALKKSEYDDISALTNPTVKRVLLDAFAKKCDSAAVDLQAAALPRQKSHVILPVTDLKDTEVYAPNYRNGETVVLIRYPHGGTFEIPELTVNNSSKQGKSVIGNSSDAIGINSKVAARLSGADFDGDTVLVIPNNNGAIKTSKALKALENFDPKEAYPAYEGMPKIKSKTKQTEMGKISNLITDMTIQGATPDELARAVKHSMVVIDSEKHNLNYKQSYKDNQISQLKDKYQNGKGAATLISKAGSPIRVGTRKESIDQNSGEIVYTPKNETYVDKKGKTQLRTTKSTPMAETKDAFTLSSGSVMETHYATYANSMKALANQSRKDMLNTERLKYSPQAKSTYAKEVESLNSKLQVALANKPRERQAQVIANAEVKAKFKANPDLSNDDKKKIKNQALAKARARVGASKSQINITEKEWEAIQSGAISDNKLVQILNNTDLDLVKAYATPRTKQGVSSSKLARIKSMANSGYTQAEIADALGIPVSTVNNALSS